DVQCDGCAHCIRASVRRHAGVEGMAMEMDKGSMTMVGPLRHHEAAGLRRLERPGRRWSSSAARTTRAAVAGTRTSAATARASRSRTKKDEEKKEQDDECSGGGGGNAGKGKGGMDNKEPIVGLIVTVALKIGSAGLGCDGCMHRICCKLFKIKGVEQVKMDPAKNQVTVTGTMDGKALPEKLRKKLRRPVDVVPPGKGDKEKDKGGCNKDGKQQQGVTGSGARRQRRRRWRWSCSYGRRSSTTSRRCRPPSSSSTMRTPTPAPS
uniref:HMA domain-containing protein n=1 Tax=Aegilops tauschii subsp. strangulata TaxID=200361 RepID=A0A453LTG9_AEGTS